MAAELRCVVGIDVAQHAQVVCSLEAPGAAVRHKPSQIEATAEGYALLQEWLESWAEPGVILIGLEATGTLWEPLYDRLTQAGYQFVLLNPRQTASWAASLERRAKTDGSDATTLARGLLAGWARGSTLPSETIQALRTLTCARRDLVQTRPAARQRLHDELVGLFPAFVRGLAPVPGEADLGTRAVRQLVESSASADALAHAAADEVLSGGGACARGEGARGEGARGEAEGASCRRPLSIRRPVRGR